MLLLVRFCQRTEGWFASTAPGPILQSAQDISPQEDKPQLGSVT